MLRKTPRPFPPYYATAEMEERVYLGYARLLPRKNAQANLPAIKNCRKSILPGNHLKASPFNLSLGFSHLASSNPVFFDKKPTRTEHFSPEGLLKSAVRLKSYREEWLISTAVGDVMTGIDRLGDECHDVHDVEGMQKLILAYWTTVQSQSAGLII